MTRVVCDFCMTRAARALEITCDSRKQKLAFNLFAIVSMFLIFKTVELSM